MAMVACRYYARCMHRGIETRCMTCKNNTVRNKEEDLYEAVADRPFPETCPKLSYTGPAEHTAGYECPVCGGFTSPYHISQEEPYCKHCGYRLNF